MKVSNTIIAVVILAVLGGVFYYLEQQPAAPSAEEAAKQKVFAFDPAQVEEFTIESLNEPAFTVRRAAAAADQAGGAAPQTGAAQWQITAPAEIAADTTEVESFITAIPTLESIPVEGDAPLAASEYGLDAPQKTLRFKLRDGQTVALSIGNQNITSTSKYGKLDSSPNVFLIETANAGVLDKTLFNLRDKRAIPLVVDQAQQIEVEFNYKEGAQAGQKGRLVLTKQQDGNWHLTEPAVRTDFGSSNYFVTSLSGAVMSAVEEEAPAAASATISRYGLNQPAIRLTVKLADGKSANLLVGNKAGDEAAYFAQNSVWPQIFKINQFTFDQFNQQIDNYRSRSLFDFQTSNARRVEILWSGGEMRLDKRGEEWFRTGTPEAKVETAKVETFLNDVTALRVQQFPTDRAGQFAQYGLNQPWMRVKVTYGENNQEETVVFARKDSRFYAARQGENSIYEMSPEEPDNIEPKVRDLTS